MDDSRVHLDSLTNLWNPCLRTQRIYIDMKIFWVMQQQLIFCLEMTKSMNSQEQHNQGRLSLQETKTAQNNNNNNNSNNNNKHLCLLLWHFSWHQAWLLADGYMTQTAVRRIMSGSTFFTFTVSSNSWLNIVIYFLWNESFRKNVQELFKRNKSNNKRETTFSSISGSIEK